MRIITVNLPISYIRSLENNLCGDDNLFLSRSESIRNALRLFISQLVENANFVENIIKDWRESFGVWLVSNSKKMTVITINIPDDYVDFLDTLVSKSIAKNRSEAVRIAIHKFVNAEHNFLQSVRKINENGIFETNQVELEEPTDNQIRQIMQSRNIPIYSHGDNVYIKENENIVVKTVKRRAAI